ncbi:MAG: hypothetical protein K6D96_08865 [Acetatifactor sp.]|nr:hypothetical protein [Acetatifactor sp.]
MEKKVLSLKNVYKFIVNSDYPVYSDGIIPTGKKKGLTINKFWQDSIVGQFRNEKCGILIWRVSGTRNRYTSEFINRSGDLYLVSDYANELKRACNDENIGMQISVFMSFFENHGYRYDSFEKKIKSLIDMFAENDRFFAGSVEKYFKRCLESIKKIIKKGDKGELFGISFVCTMLTLFAMFGDEMAGKEIVELTGRDCFDPEYMWSFLNSGSFMSDGRMEYLTNQKCEVCRSALKYNHFYGREIELYCLKEMLAGGRKVVVSGIGGIGKTELLRQFLRCCIEDGLADYVCTIQYEKSLADSFSKAFSNLTSHVASEALREVIRRINVLPNKKVLILIDNMNVTEANDPDISLLKTINASIFITSRQESIDGFESYPLSPLSNAASRLVFADNFGKVLSEEEYGIIDKMLDIYPWHHALTVQLVAKTASKLGWGVSKIYDVIRERGMDFPLHGDKISSSMASLYRNMFQFSGVRKKYGAFLVAFSFLPYRGYGMEFLKQNLADFIESDSPDKVEKCVADMKRDGWLEVRDGSISMHPFVAESIRNLKNDDKTPVKLMNNLCSFLDEFDGTTNLIMSRKAELAIDTALICLDHLDSDTLLKVMYCFNSMVSYLTVSEGASKLIDAIEKLDNGSDDKIVVNLYRMLITTGYKSADYIAERLEELEIYKDRNKTKYDSFLAALAVTCFESYMFDLAEELCDRCMKESNLFEAVITCYYVKANCTMVKDTDYKKTIAICAEGLDYALKYNTEGDGMYAMLLMIYGIALTMDGNVYDAENVLSYMQEQLGDYSGIRMECIVSYLEAIVDAGRGNYDMAMEEMKRVMGYMDYLGRSGATSDTMCHISMIDICIKAGRYGEAAKYLPKVKYLSPIRKRLFMQIQGK